jgi:beta-galactosidase
VWNDRVNCRLIINQIKMRIILSVICFTFPLFVSAQDSRVVLDLNGTWDFEQSENSEKPSTFSRTIRVPGLIHLANPKIEDYDKFFKGKDREFRANNSGRLVEDYTPRYNWYRKIIVIPEEYKDKKASISILKSQFVTQVIVNGFDLGSSMSCFTPIEFAIGDFIKYGEKNEIVIRTGDRRWLPKEAAGGFDAEKQYYLPGIWDDVSLVFTEELKLNRVLLLPSALEGKVIIKTSLHSLYPPQLRIHSTREDTCTIEIFIREKESGKNVGHGKFEKLAVRGRESLFEDEISIENTHLWTPEDPFLYEADIILYDKERESDRVRERFGMRDFESKGNHFYLNGEKIYLRGANITLHRFFEDPECKDLAWDRAWVTKLLTNTKNLNWNAMRICVGLVPDFWYDIADSCGLLLQNEWMYWQHHGWPEQIRKEFSDWVWADGNHPSIVIWDAINENSNEFIGRTLVPELKKIDPTRIWDVGYMGEGYHVGKADMNVELDEMDEPHLYSLKYFSDTSALIKRLERDPYFLGEFDNLYEYNSVLNTAVPQLCNEYGWIWLWRDGTPTKLTKPQFDYFCGINATPSQRREFQAYWIQIDTEWLRAERGLAGILAFTYLTNNYGFTGDWFLNPIGDLKPGITLKWLKHCFAPVGVFLNLQDQRYMKYGNHYDPGEEILFNILGVNDLSDQKSGRYSMKIIDSEGRTFSELNGIITIPAYQKKYEPVAITMPDENGGYLILLEFFEDGKTEAVLSRRYIKIGKGSFSFYDYKL